MDNQQLNHEVAIKINGWIHDEGIFYHDTAGFTCYLADYCNSIAHALDIAKTQGIGLAPTPDGWSAYLVSDSAVNASDSVAARAIVLTALKAVDVTVK